jgi:hypothetical protein
VREPILETAVLTVPPAPRNEPKALVPTAPPDEPKALASAPRLEVPASPPAAAPIPIAPPPPVAALIPIAPPPVPADEKPAPAREPDRAGPISPSTPPVSRAEAQRLLDRSGELLERGDIAGARLLLARAASSGHAQATFALAETYDPNMLSLWKARGIKADPARAKALYTQALADGVAEARPRLAELR